MAVRIRKLEPSECRRWPMLAGMWQAGCDCGAWKHTPSHRTAQAWKRAHLAE